jgi:spermidine/putrescine transport system ATP-binding protein
MTSLVSVQNLTMRYGSFAALDDVSLEIAPGNYTVLLGPSGSGKTTLLSILGGFLEPTSGSVKIGEEDCTFTPPAKRPTATVFQDYALFPHMTVAENVGFGLRMRGVSKTQRDEKSHAMLNAVGLPDAFTKKPHQLSGGQRQRVALARALVVEPQLLLLDEPLGALDLKLRRHMQDELKALQKRVGTAFVHVTHDQEEAMALADQIVVMNKGRIEDQGVPERVYERPATAFTASFMGESTILPGSSRIAKTFGSTDLAIRPEHIRIAKSHGNLGSAIVDTIVYQGSFKRVLAKSLDDQGTLFIVRTNAETRVIPGSTVSLHVEPKNVISLQRPV